MIKQLSLILFFLFISVFSYAQPSNKIIFDADFMEKDNKKKTVTLKGNVNVIFQEQHLLCEQAIIYENTQMILAEGNVILQTAKTTLRGERLEFDYNSNKGKLYSGVITSGQVLIESKVIEKIGDEEYIANDAYYTSCLTCPPSWGFTSKKIHAEIGGYATIYQPWLYILQVPVLPLPYLVVPLNTKRQTGFLVPKPILNTGGGVALEQPYFWAIDRSHDATISGIIYEKRGVQGLLNYRYYVTEESSGLFNGGYMYDKSFKDGDRNRWFADYAHYYKLPNNYVQRTKVQLTSDSKYTQDFFQQFSYRGEPALDNRVSLTKKFESSLLTFDSSFYVNLLENQIRYDYKDSLHRLPEINFTLSEQNLFEDFPLMFNLEAQYLNVTRNDLGFDNIIVDPTNPNGRLIDNLNNTGFFDYQDGDLVRTGQRLDIQTSLSSPFWLGRFIDIDPKVTARYTQYSLGVKQSTTPGFDSFPSRFYMQGDLSARTYFNKVYGFSDANKFKHTIIPEITLRSIPSVTQTKSSFFGTTEQIPAFREKQNIDNSDLLTGDKGRGIQFDSRDRVTGRQLLNFSFSNIFLQKSVSNSGSKSYRRSILLNLSQAYDLWETRLDDGRPWQDVVGLLQLNFDRFSHGTSVNYYPYLGISNLSSSVQYKYFKENFIQLSYTHYYTIFETRYANYTDSVVLGSGFYTKWLDFVGSVEYSPHQEGKRDGEGNSISGFKRWSVSTLIKPPGECWVVKADLSQALDAEDIQISASMNFEFGK